MFLFIQNIHRWKNVRELYLNENLGLIGDVGLELFSLDFERDLRLAKFTDNADITPLPLSCR